MSSVRITPISSAVRGGYGLQQLKERCINDLRIAEDITDSIVKIWRRSSHKLATSLLQRSLSNNSLIDMDWSFGVTAASDDCDHIGKTYLQLKLVIDSIGSPSSGSSASAGDAGSTNGGRARCEELFIELSLDQFYQFLASLEKCKSYLDYVSPRAGQATVGSD